MISSSLFTLFTNMFFRKPPALMFKKIQGASRNVVRFAILLIGALAMGLIYSLPAIDVISAPETSSDGILRHDSITRHVVLISIDGLRPDAIQRFGATTLLRLIQEGGYAIQAETSLPKTLPSHATMLTGVAPAVHGITWNEEPSLSSKLFSSDEYMLKAPTAFDILQTAGLSSAAFFSKAKLRLLIDSEPAVYAEYPSGLLSSFWDTHWTADRVADKVSKYLLEDGKRPSLLFVHIAEPDVAGHKHGWMSSEYRDAVRAADDAIEEILALADSGYGEGCYTAIITADHGGNGHKHGGSDPRSTAIPWITVGNGVRPGKSLTTRIRTEDTAATVLWLLNVAVPKAWTGKPVTSAYSTFEPSRCRGG